MAFCSKASRLGKLIIISTIWQLVSQTWAEDNPKRAPSGFTGVRGKKSVDSNDLQNGRFHFSSEGTPTNEVSEEEFPLNAGVFGYKRGSMGFVGMRGKKESIHRYYQDALNKEIQKIRSNCKLYPGNIHCEDLDPEAFKFLIDAAQMNSDESTNAVNTYGDYPSVSFPVFGRQFEVKRAPMGFMGMRGKKYFDDNTLFKRAPSGFMGMRGKKNYLTDNMDLLDFDDSEQIIGGVSKRAPQAGFFGMRGKKMPGNTFFGMRGKKGPYDFPFRGKFVGVRGKKSIFYNVNDQNEGSNAEQD